MSLIKPQVWNLNANGLTGMIILYKDLKEKMQTSKYHKNKKI